MALIKLSFKQLPSILLKGRFAYCVIFEEDVIIEKARLIQLWIAQGLLYDEVEQLRDEQLVEKYFCILLDNSPSQDEQFEDRVKKY